MAHLTIEYKSRTSRFCRPSSIGSALIVIALSLSVILLKLMKKFNGFYENQVNVSKINENMRFRMKIVIFAKKKTTQLWIIKTSKCLPLNFLFTFTFHCYQTDKLALAYVTLFSSRCFRTPIRIQFHGCRAFLFLKRRLEVTQLKINNLLKWQL